MAAKADGLVGICTEDVGRWVCLSVGWKLHRASA